MKPGSLIRGLLFALVAGLSLGTVAVADDQAPQGKEVDIVALDEALTKLNRLDARQGRIVELRFLAGLSVEETAEILDVSPRTVKLDWRMAKAWLRSELGGE